ncbi:hypothetical protein OPKNFCMD_5656 [Methylobacterium crusticola]|uniref:Uncharacterized protein n=1 Tax=Methylobacterium crusticola TaxID=1697972 RepID=A0ABQ4R6P3_9HYPH|nr:hypothetical protein OPKNFCMD_5656 [Methylobacterium crusticola]
MAVSPGSTAASAPPGRRGRGHRRAGRRPPRRRGRGRFRGPGRRRAARTRPDRPEPWPASEDEGGRHPAPETMRRRTLPRSRRRSAAGPPHRNLLSASIHGDENLTSNVHLANKSLSRLASPQDDAATPAPLQAGSVAAPAGPCGRRRSHRPRHRGGRGEGEAGADRGRGGVCGRRRPAGPAAAPAGAGRPTPRGRAHAASGSARSRRIRCAVSRRAGAARDRGRGAGLTCTATIRPGAPATTTTRSAR